MSTSVPGYRPYPYRRSPVPLFTPVHNWHNIAQASYHHLASGRFVELLRLKM